MKYHTRPRTPYGKVTQTQEKHHIQESQEVSLFSASDHKAAWIKQNSMTDTHETQIKKNDPQKNHKSMALVRSARKFLEGLNMFGGISDVVKDK